MKVTRNAKNLGISESSDFQNSPELVPGPPNNIHIHQIFSLLRLIGVRLQPCDKTVSRKKKLATVIITSERYTTDGKKKKRQQHLLSLTKLSFLAIFIKCTTLLRLTQ